MSTNLASNGPKKPYRNIIGVLFICLLAALFLHQQRNGKSSVQSVNQPKLLTRVGQQHNIPNRSSTAPVQGTIVSSTNAPSVPHVLSRAERHPRAVVLEAREIPLGQNIFLRTELIRTSMKYPFLRSETRLSRDETGKETVLHFEEVAADHVLVELQPGKTKNDLEPAIQKINGTVLKKVQIDFGESFLVALPSPTIDGVPDAIRDLSSFKTILKVVEGDGLQYLQTTPNDPKFSQQWSLNNTGQTGGASDADVDGPQAWSLQTGSSSVIIAVSDTGVDYTHPDLQANICKNPRDPVNVVDDDQNGYLNDYQGWNFVDGNNDPYDTVDHGTMVAGIIAAQGNNGIGISGITWRCKILPVRVLDEEGGYISDIAEGFTYAKRMGAKIINGSHGGYGTSSVMESAVADLQSAGVLLIAAAGNENINNDVDPIYPASYPNKNVISVGYTGKNDQISEFSNYGLQTVDLAAPGISILSTIPGASYATASGSSFATPHVAGAAALLKSQYPSWTYLQIRNAILNNVESISAMYGMCVTGGRLNIAKAFRGAISRADAIDNTSIVTTTSSSAWYGQATFSHDGSDAAASGDISGNQSTWMESSIYGPGQIGFWWKVSCEQGSDTRFDYLQFTIDGVEKAFIDGEVAWQHQLYAIPSGLHVVRWRYVKDPYVNLGQDRGWVDQVTFVGEPPSITVHPVSQTVNSGAAVSFSVAVEGTPPFSYQWKQNGTNIAGATNATFTIASAKVGHSGVYTVNVSNRFGSAVGGPATLDVCAFNLDLSSATYPAVGGNSNLTITGSGECSWVATSSVDWITLEQSGGVGSGTLNYNVAANADNRARMGVITISGATFTVTQSGAPSPTSAGNQTLTFSITNAVGNFPSNGTFVLSTTSANTYKIVALAGATTNSSGTFNFNRIDFESATLELSNGGDPVVTVLSFEDLRSGHYLSTNSLGDSQSGTFTIGASEPDLTGDGLADLILQYTNGQTAAWSFRGTNYLGSYRIRNGQSPGSTWKAAAIADANRDGDADIYFQNADGKVAIWYLHGVSFAGSSLVRGGVSPGAAWRLAAVADFNNDDKVDLLFQDNTGRIAIWLMDGPTFISSALLRNGVAAGKDWRLVGTSDVNKDGHNDILWQNSAGVVVAWHMMGTDFLWSSTLRNGQGSGSAWKVVAINDFNFDGNNDLLFQGSNGKMAVWFMNGGSYLGSTLLRNGQALPLGWRIVGPK